MINMGNLQTVEIGSKSTKLEAIDKDELIDWKDSKNALKAKKELYTLFLNNKIILADELHSYKEKVESLELEVKSLQDSLSKHKSTSSNSPGVSPVWSSSQEANSPREPEYKSNSKKDENDDEEDVKDYKPHSKYSSSAGSMSRIAEKIKAAQANLRKTKSRP